MKKYSIETFKTEKDLLDFINWLPIDDNFKLLHNDILGVFTLLYKLK